MQDTKEIAVIFMVAGLSKRFEGKPKWLIKVGPQGESFIEYLIKQALPAGFTKIIFIVSNKTKDLFKKEFGDNYKGTPILYALQDYNENERDKPWGTLDALCCAKHFLDCPFVICSGDDIYGESAFKILVYHLKNKSTEATVGYKLKNVLSEDGSVNRGVFKVDSNNNVKSIEEVFNITKDNFKSKDLSEDSLCSMLFFGLHLETLDLLNEILINFKKQHEGDREIEFLLPNEIGKLIEQGKIVMRAYPTNNKWFGVTNPEDEEKVREELQKLHNKN